jgi:hypothetical protein
MRRFFSRGLLAALGPGLFLCAALVGGASALLRGHEVPGQVLVQMLAKAEGGRLRVLVRLPLVAMQDIDFPQHGPGYLNIPDAEPWLRQGVEGQVAPGISAYENGNRLGGQQIVAVMASLPSNRSFAAYDQALAHVLGPRLADSVDIVWQQAMLDVLLEYPIESDRSNFSIDPALARLGQRTQTLLQYVMVDGSVRSFDLRGNPGVVPLDPHWYQAAVRFATLGFWHILDGIEHLLFLACLVIPTRRIRPLVASVGSFTIAHTVTLIASLFFVAPNVLWFSPLIDALIALSIGYLAFENALGERPKRRWLVAFVFGLVHGVAFSFALRETVQFAGRHQIVSLLAFNAGIGFAQVVVVAALATLVSALFRFAVPARAGAIVLSGLVAHTAWHWIVSRGAELRLYDITLALPAFDSQLLPGALRWGILLVVVGSLLWVMSRVFPKLEQSADTGRASS